MSTPKQDAHVIRALAQLKGYFKRAYSGKSKSAAIRAKCLDCVGQEDHAKRIGNCFIEICPLWAYRPFVNSPMAIKERLEKGIIIDEKGIRYDDK